MKRTEKAIATGAEQNLSWNCGIEGQSAYPEVERLRNRQIKNFLALTLLATGTPMRLMGDEVRRTQGGNNNAYCQNNEISRLDWGLAEQHADIRRFIKELVALRINRDLPVERLDMTLHELLRRQPVQWHGIELNSPDWSHHTHSLSGSDDPPARIPVPAAHHHQRLLGNRWNLKFRRWSKRSNRCGGVSILISTRPTIFAGSADAQTLHASSCRVQPRSVVILLART
jgi:pullulanase/glycogen debranching enzyme